MNVFWPVITYSAPSRSARVAILVESEPASGSVIPNAWSRSSPAASGGSQRRFCSSLPCLTRAPIV